MEIPVNRPRHPWYFGIIGVWTNEPAFYALFALFALFVSDRMISLPIGDTG